MKLIFSSRSKHDLEQIYTYIAAEHKPAAKKLLNRLRDQCKYLRHHPEIGPSRSYIMKTLRCLPVDHFVIYYTVKPKEITILRVLHAAQDVSEHF